MTEGTLSDVALIQISTLLTDEKSALFSLFFQENKTFHSKLEWNAKSYFLYF